MEAGDRSQLGGTYTQQEGLALGTCTVVGISHRGLSWHFVLTQPQRTAAGAGDDVGEIQASGVCEGKNLWGENLSNEICSSGGGHWFLQR